MTPTICTDAEDIGETAGMVWNFLHDNGEATLNKVTKQLGVSRDAALQAVGWLAREDKLTFEQTNRSRLIRLK